MSDRTPKCKVYPGADGRWRWSMVAGNGEIQSPSQGYATKRGAERGFYALQRNARRAVVVFCDCAPSERKRKA